MLHASSPSSILVADLTSTGPLHYERSVSCIRSLSRRKRSPLLHAQSTKKGDDDPYAKVSKFGSELAASQEAQFLAAMQDATQYAMQDELRQQREAAAQQKQRKWKQLLEEKMKKKRQQVMNQSDAQLSQQAETPPDAARTSDANSAAPLSDADASQIDEDAHQRYREAGGSGYTDQAAGMELFKYQCMCNHTHRCIEITRACVEDT